MSQDLVKALGVKVIEEVIYEGNGQYTKSSVVFVDDLRAALEKLPVVYGVKGDEFGNFCRKTDTHRARLFAIEEIKREPLKHEFYFLVGSGICAIPEYFKGKTVKVTVQETVGE